MFPIGGNLLGRVEPDSTDFDFGDVLDGVPEIANFIFPQTNTRKARRRTYHPDLDAVSAGEVRSGRINMLRLGIFLVALCVGA